LAILATLATLFGGCAGSAADDAGDAPTSITSGADRGEDFEATATDFTNLADMTRVRGFFIDNRIGRLDEAVALATAGGEGTYPVGTIIQLIPQEAMVKRYEGFDPSSNDWEFFELDVSDAGTVIHQRGGAEIVNRFGSGSCAACHSAAGDKFDFVCEDTHGCDPLPVSRDLIEGLQQSDPRPIR
jgi:hypothetical protein